MKLNVQSADELRASKKRVRGSLGSTRVSRVGFGVAPEQSFLWISLARCDGNRRQKFAIAKAFVRDMRAFHAEKDAIKRDEIASRQIHFLRQYQGKNERPIKLHQVKQMFEEMKNQ